MISTVMSGLLKSTTSKILLEASLFKVRSHRLGEANNNRYLKLPRMVDTISLIKIFSNDDS